ncbi:exported hypothetical protein [Capnocytophaga canis]|uniref:Conjugative transposon protein TraN n=2 Tax=Capnocytophaga canis TaxID=1848903 RepID=A0A0B7IQA1_9FLAO|nr:exported hypothetical protein [Capnocytophaga canis]
MKKMCVILIFFLFKSLNGQDLNLEDKRDTNVIEVSKGYKTLLIFPEEIAEDVLGNDLEFTSKIIEKDNHAYHRRIVQLQYVQQARDKNNATNYSVITKSGNIYEFLLKEVIGKPQKTSYEVFTSKTNGNIYMDNDATKKMIIQGKEYDQIVGAPYTYYTYNNEDTVEFNDIGIHDSPWYHAQQNTLDSLYAVNKIAYYKIQCYKNKNNKELGKGRDFERDGKVFLWLKGVYYHKNEIYIDVLLENRESLDYVVDFVKAKLSTNYKKKSSKQSVNHKALLLYNVPTRVPGNTSQRFQIVFDRFTISEKRILEIEIKEKNGERDLRIEVPKKEITNPITI